MTIYRITQQDGHEFTIGTDHYEELEIDPMIEEYEEDDEFVVEQITEPDQENT
jgi:hypothetical protein